jgi:hypothetical protein
MDIIKPLYIYVSTIGPISGHMTLTIALAEKIWGCLG